MLPRHKLFQKGYLQEGQWVQLRYGQHALQRLQQRSRGSLCVTPTRIQIVSHNVLKGDDEDGQLNFFIYRLPYDRYQELILVVTRQFFVKSLWFRKTPSKHVIFNPTAAAHPSC